MDFVFHRHRYTAEKQVQLATTGLDGYALEWWYQLANKRRRFGDSQVSSWHEMKAVMKKRFVAKRYDLERFQNQSRSAQERVRTPRDKPNTYYGREAQRKSHLLQTHLGYLDYLQSTEFKENLRSMIVQSLTAVVQNQPERSVPRPTSGIDELGYYQKEPAEKKKETAAKPAEKEQEIESKEKESLPAMCGHVIGLIKDEERELDETLVVHKESPETLIEQGGFIRSFSCDILIQPFVCVQFNLLEHLRFVKGQQHLVFEPGGEARGLTAIENVLVQKEFATHDPSILKERDLRSNPFEGREISVVQIISQRKAKESKGWLYDTFRDLQTCPHQPKPKQLAAFGHDYSTWVLEEFEKVRDDPKLKEEYGSYFIRPTNQDNTMLSIHGHMSMSRTCAASNRGEVPSEAARSEVNRKDKLLILSAACNEIHLRHERGLQHYVFKPGEDMCVCKYRNKLVGKRARSLELIDQGFVILQGLDLRTNPFKGRGNGATWISFKLMF